MTKKKYSKGEVVYHKASGRKMVISKLIRDGNYKVQTDVNETETVDQEMIVSEEDKNPSKKTSREFFCGFCGERSKDAYRLYGIPNPVCYDCAWPFASSW